ncbi:MAG: hypothetical protein KDK70_01435 [Myxococcales bacterium]|nr:hypothetical protein [Myxococcales bacterium]
MTTSFNRSTLILATLAIWSALTDHAHATESGTRQIPTQLVNTPDVGDLSGPCSLCRVNDITADEDTSGQSATLELYFDDESGSFWGGLELTILLDSGEYRSMALEGVGLLEQQHAIFELDPEPDFDWGEDVIHVWVEVVRGDV